jgi:FKBP-type peptidyl-prolyl cis-trans isomerase
MTGRGYKALPVVRNTINHGDSDFMKRLVITGLVAMSLTIAMLPSVQAETAGSAKKVVNVSELQKIDSVLGTGAEAHPGNEVSVHYTGWLFDEAAPESKGKKFDSSVDRGQPFNFPLGGGRVIKGWDQGVSGMKVGGKRTLIIPAAMGYGSRGAGGVIPPNATLVFDVELLAVH